MSQGKCPRPRLLDKSRPNWKLFENFEAHRDRIPSLGFKSWPSNLPITPFTSRVSNMRPARTFCTTRDKFQDLKVIDSLNVRQLFSHTIHSKIASKPELTHQTTHPVV